MPGKAATLAICFTAGKKPPTLPGLQEHFNSSNNSSSNAEFTYILPILVAFSKVNRYSC